MAIAGLRNTNQFDIPNGRRPQNYRETLLRLYPNSGGNEKAPLTALTAVMKSEATTDPVYHWFTKQLQDRRIRLAADLAASTGGTAGTITVDTTVSSAFAVKVGDLLMVEQSGEIVRVSSTPTSAGTVNVVRGFTLANGAATPALVDYDGAGINPFLVVIGSAFEEGSSAPPPVSWDPIEIFNQTQIFRGTYGLTGTAQATTTRLGGEEAELKREALETFSVDMERGLWFGKKSTSILNGQPLRTTDGVLNHIPAANKRVVPNGELSYDWFESFSQDLFRYGSSEKMAFCGGGFLGAVAQMVRKNGEGTYQLSESVSEYGMKGIRRLHTPQGTLVLKAHPLFTQMVGGTNGGTAFTSMNNSAAVLDMAGLKYRFMKGRDVKFQTNLQLPGVDGLHAGWIAEAGLELHHPNSHYLIQGAVKGVKDAA